MITLPVPRTGTVRDSAASRPVGDFDIGALRRVRRQKEKNEVRNGTYVGGFEGVATPCATQTQDTARPLHGMDGDGSCSSDSEFSVYSCISEDAVALTDEMIESQKPDILTLNVAASKPAICIRTKAVSCEDDAANKDMGLQSIMAQV